MNQFALLATTGGHGGRYANAAVLLIVGLLSLFMAFAVTARGSLARETHELFDPETDTSPEASAAREWLDAERRRARTAARLRPVLVVVGVALVLASGVASLITWW